MKNNVIPPPDADHERPGPRGDMADQHPTLKQLKAFSPFNRQDEAALKKVAAQAVVRQLQHDEVLFAHGDRDDMSYFLMKGEVTLTTAGGETLEVSSISPQSIKALSNDKPRRSTVTAVGKPIVIAVPDELLGKVAGGVHTDTYSVDDISVTHEEDWMTRFLQYLDTLKLPVANIQKVMANLKEVPVKKGTVVVRQGDIGDHYYIVKKGMCKVVWQGSPGGKAVELVNLKEGTGFGEEALINNGIRNASIVMMVDGILMRLNKATFISQVVEPLLKYVRYQDVARSLGNNGVLVDLRNPEAHNKVKMQYTINLPFTKLREVGPKLDPAKHYIVFLDQENLKLAAFLLAQYGLQVSVLKDNLDDILKLVTGYRKAPGS